MVTNDCSTISTVYDRERGCGWRQPGGLYLMADGFQAPCGRMPLALTVCSSCGAGIKPSRGWTWITLPMALCEALPTGCSRKHLVQCLICPLSPSSPTLRAGLLWCGASFYPTPRDWLYEALEQGISCRISRVPRDLVLRETWVLIAHRKAITSPTTSGALVCTPGIIQAFCPDRIEYIVIGEETAKQLAHMQQRGITPVYIERLNDQKELLSV